MYETMQQLLEHIRLGEDGIFAASPPREKAVEA
jgi:hypothetical protein